MASLKEEFIDLMTENSRINGFDELSSKLLGILYAEPHEVALEELSKRTGYSLSAISSAMKFLDREGIIKRLKKPKSKKVYFYMGKNIILTGADLLRKKYEKILLPTKQKLPKIIENYKAEESKTSKEELKIIKNYYNQLTISEKAVKDFICILENLQEEVNKK